LSTKHRFQEPWRVGRFGTIFGGPIREFTRGSSDSQIAAFMGQDTDPGDEERLDRCARAVACVNAMAGVEDPAAFVAEARSMKKMRVEMEERLAVLTANAAECVKFHLDPRDESA